MSIHKAAPKKMNNAIDWREVERRLAHVAIERIQAPAAGIVDAYCKIELTLNLVNFIVYMDFRGRSFFKG
jgi:hypothetical protein